MNFILFAKSLRVALFAVISIFLAFPLVSCPSSKQLFRCGHTGVYRHRYIFGSARFRHQAYDQHLVYRLDKCTTAAKTCL
jgi:hypothetical protein